VVEFGARCIPLAAWFFRLLSAGAAADALAVRPSPLDVDVEHELERRTLISEQRRAAILAWILTAILIGRAIYQLAHGPRENDLPGRSYVLLMIACWIALEVLTFVAVRQRLRDGRERVPLRAYLNAAVEAAMPTAVLAVMCWYDRPLNALTSSINYAYFLIIILSPLRLDAWLCFFTGAVAAAGYGVLVGSYAADLARQWVGPPALMRLSFSMRIGFLLMGGLAAAFVSRRIRTTLIETLGEARERERVVALFGQHVSPAVVNQLLSQPTGEHSELREVCVMVLDIRNFTTFSEVRPVDEVVRYLNTLWSFMVHTVNEHHGIVNKFLGDGFLAVFGAPLSTGSDCANAIAAARQIMSEVDRLVAAGELPETHIGIALHAGEAIIGNIGSAERKEYTVIGDVVNVAFRIEALNKEFGTQLLISEPVRRAAGIEGVEPIPSVAIRGRQHPVELFRLA
jgi:adenylate cyclase